MLAKIKPAVDAVKTEGDEKRDSSNLSFVNRVSEENVKQSIINLRTQSSVLSEMEQNKEISIIGAMYDVNTGLVSLL